MYEINPWKVFDTRDKKIVSICTRVEAVKLLATFLGSIPQAIKELDRLSFQNPQPYIRAIPNPSNSRKTCNIRLEIVKLPSDPNIANSFALPKKYGYNEDLTNKFWCIILSSDGKLNIFERWNSILKEMNEIEI